MAIKRPIGGEMGQPDLGQACLIVTASEAIDLRLEEALLAGNFEYLFVDAAEIHLALDLEAEPRLAIVSAMERPGSWMPTVTTIRSLYQGPLILVSGIPVSDTERQCGYDLGVDDIVYQDATAGEVHARIRAVLRRCEQQRSTQKTLHRYGRLSVDVLARKLWVDSIETEFTPKEFNVLAMLIRAQGDVVPHKKIITEVWGDAYADDAQYLRVIIVRLREKLEMEPSRPSLIVTVHGEGYRLAAQTLRDDKASTLTA